MNNQQQPHEFSCSNTSRVTNLLNNGNNAKYQQLQFDYMTTTTTSNNRGGVEEGGGGGGADSDANLTAGNGNSNTAAAAANFSTSTSSASSPQHLNNLQSSTYSNIYNYYYQNTQVYYNIYYIIDFCYLYNQIEEN